MGLQTGSPARELIASCQQGQTESGLWVSGIQGLSDVTKDPGSLGLCLLVSLVLRPISFWFPILECFREVERQFLGVSF